MTMENPLDDLVAKRVGNSALLRGLLLFSCIVVVRSLPPNFCFGSSISVGPVPQRLERLSSLIRNSAGFLCQTPPRNKRPVTVPFQRSTTVLAFASES